MLSPNWVERVVQNLETKTTAVAKDLCPNSKALAFIDLKKYDRAKLGLEMAQVASPLISRLFDEGVDLIQKDTPNLK